MLLIRTKLGRKAEGNLARAESKPVDSKMFDFPVLGGPTKTFTLPQSNRSSLTDLKFLRYKLRIKASSRVLNGAILVFSNKLSSHTIIVGRLDDSFECAIGRLGMRSSDLAILLLRSRSRARRESEKSVSEVEARYPIYATIKNPITVENVGYLKGEKVSKLLYP